MQVSLSELIDKLTIVNIKIFLLVDIMEKCEGPAELLATAAKNCHALNRQRSQLKNAIEEMAKSGNIEVKL